jgi:transcriptional regulator with XRE-family HTH domain
MSDASAPAEDWAGYLRRMTRREGWSVQRLADESGVHRSRLFKYMAGDSGVTIDTIRRIAAALGDDPESALRAAAQIRTPVPVDVQDEEVALIMRAPVDDELRQVMLRKLYERRERDRRRRLEDFQEMIDMAKRDES